MTDNDVIVVVVEEEPTPVVLVADSISFGGDSGDTGDLADRVDDVEDSLAAEATTRAAADTAEASARSSAVASEAAARASADATEASTRSTADTALDGRLDVIESDYATSGDVSTAIDDLVDGAPGILDTLGEIAVYLADTDDAATALAATVAAETVARTSADSALDGRLDVIESAGYATSSDISTAVAAEAALARNAANLTSGTIDDARIPSVIARDSEVSSAVAAEAALARDATNLTSGTIDDARIPSTIARDSEVTSAVAGKQDSSAELTALAALTGTSYGRGFIPLADSTAAREKIRIFSGTTATSGATAAKTATITGYTPASGDVLYLTFSNGNTAASTTLNINSGGAKFIYIGGNGAGVPSFTLTSGAVVAMVYDGTQWNVAGLQSQYSAASQAQIEAGTGTTIQWMTPERIKQAITYNASPKRETIQSITASGNYNPALTDERTILEFSHATVAQALVIPADGTVNFTVGSELRAARFGAAAVTVDGTAVTLYAITSASAVTSITIPKHGEVIVRKRAANTWFVTGDVT